MRLKRDKHDKVFSDLVRCRSNYTCESCGKECHGDLSMLDCSHYISRAHKRTRWHPDNAFAHCKSCHHKLGGNPGAFYQHYIEKRGIETEQQVQSAAKRSWRATKDQKELLYRHYVNQLKIMHEMRRDGHIGWLDFDMLEVG